MRRVLPFDDELRAEVATALSARVPVWQAGVGLSTARLFGVLGPVSVVPRRRDACACGRRLTPVLARVRRYQTNVLETPQLPSPNAELPLTLLRYTPRGRGLASYGRRASRRGASPLETGIVGEDFGSTVSRSRPATAQPHAGPAQISNDFPFIR